MKEVYSITGKAQPRLIAPAHVSRVHKLMNFCEIVRLMWLDRRIIGRCILHTYT